MAYKAYLLALAIKMMALPKLPVLISQSGFLLLSLDIVSLFPIISAVQTTRRAGNLVQRQSDHPH